MPSSKMLGVIGASITGLLALCGCGGGVCVPEGAANSSGSLRSGSFRSEAFQGVSGERSERLAEASIIEAGDVPGAVRAGAVVLDVRGEAEHAAGHLPGAIRVDYDEWAELSLSDKTGLEHEQAWRDRIGALGISGRDRVLIYDAGKMTRAARVWFILHHFGVAGAAVVNGGFPVVEAEARQGRLALEQGSTLPRGVAFVPELKNADRLIGLMDRHEVKASIERGEAQVLDARTAQEYSGEDWRKNPRGGHLPEAVNVPHAALLDANGKLRSAAELSAILERAGMRRGVPVITHCDGGGRASLAALAAARAGYGPIVNYYLSFGDWAKDASCPVVLEARVPNAEP